MSIFSTFLELHFSGLKSFIFYPEYQKIFLSGFFGTTKACSEDVFCDSFPRHFDEITVLLYARLYCQAIGKCQTEKPKFWIGGFAKCRFFRLFKNLTFQVWKAFFSIQNIKKCFFLPFFLLKNNIWEKGQFFDKNHGLTPLQNVDFFRLCENFTFQV